MRPLRQKQKRLEAAQNVQKAAPVEEKKQAAPARVSKIQQQLHEYSNHFYNCKGSQRRISKICEARKGPKKAATLTVSQKLPAAHQRPARTTMNCIPGPVKPISKAIIEPEPESDTDANPFDRKKKLLIGSRLVKSQVFPSLVKTVPSGSRVFQPGLRPSALQR